MCADIGDRLGCGGAMKSLVRTRSGDFYLEDAVTLDEIEKLTQQQRIGEKIVPVEEMFLNLFRAHTVPQADRKLMNGNALTCDELGIPDAGAGEMIRVCDSRGHFAAVYRRDERNGVYRPWRMLQENDE